MMYYIAASVPAEIQVISPSESTLFTSMVDDIYCSRWSSAFAKSKVLGMPKEFQSQLYINSIKKFVSSRTCPKKPSVGQSTFGNSSPSSIPNSGSYTPSSSPYWGDVFK